jgi:hypothetical protein
MFQELGLDLNEIFFLWDKVNNDELCVPLS